MYEINRAAVIGAGTMGLGIAGQLANAGVDVLLLDIPAEGDHRKAIAPLAIKRMIPLPWRDGSHESLPLFVLQLDVAVDKRIAECRPCYLARVQKTNCIQQIPRQLAKLFKLMLLRVHVEIDAIARITLVGDAVQARGNDRCLQ